MSDSPKAVQKDCRRRMAQNEALLDPKEEVFSDEEVGPSKKKSKMIQQGEQNKENYQVGSIEKEPKKEVVSGDGVEESMRMKNETIGKNEQSSTSRKNDEQDTSPLSGFKKLIDDVTEMKKYHGQLQEQIPNIKQETDRLDAKMNETIQKFGDNTATDRVKMRELKETISIIEEKLKCAGEEKEVEKEEISDFQEIISQLKMEYGQKLESAEISIQKLTEENSQFKGKMEKEHKDSIKNIKSYLKEKISKIGSGNENKMKSAEDLIQKLTDENHQLAESHFEKKLAKMESEHAEKLELAETANRQLYDRISKLEEKQELETKNRTCACTGTPFLEFSSDSKVPLTRAEIEFQSKCIFCESANHHSINCRVYPDYTDRGSKLMKDNRCKRCLEPNNTKNYNHVPCPRAMVACSNCCRDIERANALFDFHHPIVCEFNDQSPYREMKRQQENENRKLSGLPPIFPSS